MAIKSLSEVLVQKGYLTLDQIKQYKKEIENSDKSRDKKSLGSYLLGQKIITPEQLAESYSHQFNILYIDKITEKMADPEMLTQIPLRFLRENIIIPIFYNNRNTIVTSNPEDFQPIDELTFILGGDVQLAVSDVQTIMDAINRYYPLEGSKEVIEELEGEDVPGALEFGEIQEEDILSGAGEAPIIKLVNYILYQAVKQGASDIHIEPFEKELRVRYRIDGVMHTVIAPPKRIQSALISRIKIMSNLNIAEKRIPQDGRIQIKVADKPIDIRVSVLPTSYGERVVMRLLDKSKSFSALESLGFENRDLKIIKWAITQPNGIILITGPTGSGKTSTLYSILNELNKPGVNIITVEDPVEYQMSGIGQVQVREKIGLTFAASLRSILRQDPDIIMIGETRDQETAQIAIQSALTGHLVLSTLHTNSAPATITRLIDMGVEPFLVASTLLVVLAQRLVRRLCDFCKEAYKPQLETLRKLGLTEEQASKITFYKAVGCPECLDTGYKGRLALFEVMVITSEIAELIIQKADTKVITRQAEKDGMETLLQDGIEKIKEGKTTISEVLAVAASQEVSIQE